MWAAGGRDGDLGEAIWTFLRRQFCWSWCFFHPVDLTYDQEYNQCHENKVYDGVDEDTIVDGCCACRLSIRQGGVFRPIQ